MQCNVSFVYISKALQYLLSIKYEHYLFCIYVEKYYIRYYQQSRDVAVQRLYGKRNNMVEKFQNKYRISSTRLKNWDYGQNGAYFITICTGNKEHFFGEIISVDGKNIILLNEIGKLANDFWAKIPEHFPFVELGNFVVMPNHVHGILIIDKKMLLLMR